MHDLRNIAILAHVDAGKTTLTERLLHVAGAIRHAGAVEHGSTVTDWRPQEQRRGITMTTAASTCRWRDHQITIVDTPGHVDFSLEVQRGLRVIDGVVLVISAGDGVQPQTESHWHAACRYQLPAIGFINKLDRPGHEDERLLEQINKRLGIVPVPLVFVTDGADALRFVDVVAGTAYQVERSALSKHQPASALSVELSDDERVRLELARELMVDVASSFDESFLVKALGDEALTAGDYWDALRVGVTRGKIMPLVYGMARFGVGVATCADAIVDLLPDPSHRQPRLYDPRGQALGPLASNDAGLGLFVFKTELRRQGTLAFVRSFGSRLDPSATTLVESASHTPVADWSLVEVFGVDLVERAYLEPGQIGGIVLPEGGTLRSGMTLTSKEAPIAGTFESIHPPSPVISTALEADSEAGHERLRAALDLLVRDDSSLRTRHDRVTGSLVLAGMGELHLATAIDRIREDFNLEVTARLPRVELTRLPQSSGIGAAEWRDGSDTITIEVDVSLTGDVGVATVVADPLTGKRIRPESWAALLSGLDHALGLDGHDDMVVGARLTLTMLHVAGGAHAPVAFRDVASDAARSALEAASVVTAEPWSRLHVSVPGIDVGRVVGDLARRGADIGTSISRGEMQTIAAVVPMRAVIGYATDLRSLTGGRGFFSLDPAGYRPQPDHIR